MFYLVDDISLDLFPGNCTLEVHSLDLENARRMLGCRPFKSGILDPTLTNLLENLLGLPINVAIESPRPNFGDEIVIAKYLGPSIPKGATTIPEGGKFIFVYLKHTW